MRFEIEDRQVTEFACPDCDGVAQRVAGFINRDSDAYAIYFASCYHHDGHEAWIDVIFSPTWAEGADDHVTFGARVGPFPGQPDPGATLTIGGLAFDDSPTFGRKLTRDDALAHPRLRDFWEALDHVLVHDPLVRDHVYGPGAILEESL